MTSLTFLNLGSNQIANIDAGAFTDLASLLGLSLVNNRLGSLRNNLFSSQINLDVLALNNNALCPLSMASAANAGLSEPSILRYSYPPVSGSLFSRTFAFIFEYRDSHTNHDPDSNRDCYVADGMGVKDGDG